jgi:hypothetical protein
MTLENGSARNPWVPNPEREEGTEGRNDTACAEGRKHRLPGTPSPRRRSVGHLEGHHEKAAK